MATAIAVPGLREILQLGLPTPTQLAYVATIGITTWLLLELLKLLPSPRSRGTGAFGR
jgi:hypothetical protein